MAFNEKLADRVREVIAATHKKVKEKKMFSGLCFMVNDKMCVTVHSHRIMVRLNPELFDTAVEKEGCGPMVMSGKIMKGFVLVNEEVLKTKRQLDYWVQLALAFNKIAKSSKKTVRSARQKK
jgi:TfoX/Sxy family transcriptional regulator of competence genes